MARTNAIINGTDLGVYLGGTLVALATQCTLSMSRDMRDTSNKDSAGWKKVLPGQRNWSVSTEGLYNPSTANSYITLWAAWKDGTALTLLFKNSTQDYYWGGTVYITSLSQNAPLEGNVTWTVNFQGDGVLTETDPLAQ
jgi:predicted secreted protein